LLSAAETRKKRHKNFWTLPFSHPFPPPSPAPVGFLAAQFPVTNAFRPGISIMHRNVVHAPPRSTLPAIMMYPHRDNNPNEICQAAASPQFPLLKLFGASAFVAFAHGFMAL